MVYVLEEFCVSEGTQLGQLFHINAYDVVSIGCYFHLVLMHWVYGEADVALD